MEYNYLCEIKFVSEETCSFIYVQLSLHKIRAYLQLKAFEIQSLKRQNIENDFYTTASLSEP